MQGINKIELKSNKNELKKIKQNKNKMNVEQKRNRK